ncbi:MAG: hypothetical protein AB7K09_23110, partial [Planctomycetota bacterium]
CSSDLDLEGTPFVWVDPDGVESTAESPLVLSGNHRVMGAIEAGLELIDVKVCADRLTKDERIAIQLAHNAVVGEDDLAVLDELYHEIHSLDERERSGLDDTHFEKLRSELPGFGSVHLEHRFVVLAFLPHELEELTELLDQIEAGVRGRDEVWLAPFGMYDQFAKVLKAKAKEMQVKNTATVVMAMVRETAAALAEKQDA